MDCLPFKCNFCGYASSTLSGGVNHVNKEHSVEYPENFTTNISDNDEYVNMPGPYDIQKTSGVHCGHCGVLCVDKYQEIEHILNDHRGDDGYYVCYICKYRTDVKSYFKRHITSCFVIKDYNCHLCSYRASRKYYLKQHLKNIHGIEYSDISSENGTKTHNDAILQQSSPTTTTHNHISISNLDSIDSHKENYLDLKIKQSEVPKLISPKRENKLYVDVNIRDETKNIPISQTSSHVTDISNLKFSNSVSNIGTTQQTRYHKNVIQSMENNPSVRNSDVNAQFASPKMDNSYHNQKLTEKHQSTSSFNKSSPTSQSPQKLNMENFDKFQRNSIKRKKSETLFSENETNPSVVAEKQPLNQQCSFLALKKNNDFPITTYVQDTSSCVSYMNAVCDMQNITTFSVPINSTPSHRISNNQIRNLSSNSFPITSSKESVTSPVNMNGQDPLHGTTDEEIYSTFMSDSMNFND